MFVLKHYKLPDVSTHILVVAIGPGPSVVQRIKQSLKKGIYVVSDARVHGYFITLVSLRRTRVQ